MGSALLQGILARELCRAEDVIVRDAEPAAMDALRAALPGLRVASLNREVAEAADVVLLCVKPADVSPLLQELTPVKNTPLFISIAAGLTLAALERAAGPRHRFVRVMPNTPALIGQAASAYALGTRATPDDGALTERLLGAVGTVSLVPEKLLDAVTGLSGSGPAYLFLVAEAMVEAGVLNGLSRDVSVELASQTLLGAGRLLVESGQSAAELRANVTSPGGTTAAGLRVLEQRAVRAAVLDAVSAATERSRELGR